MNNEIDFVSSHLKCYVDLSEEISKKKIPEREVDGFSFISFERDNPKRSLYARVPVNEKFTIMGNDIIFDVVTIRCSSKEKLRWVIDKLKLI